MPAEAWTDNAALAAEAHDIAVTTDVRALSAIAAGRAAEMAARPQIRFEASRHAPQLAGLDGERVHDSIASHCE